MAGVSANCKACGKQIWDEETRRKICDDCVIAGDDFQIGPSIPSPSPEANLLAAVMNQQKLARIISGLSKDEMIAVAVMAMMDGGETSPSEWVANLPSLIEEIRKDD